jgi:hypothetical protein
MMETVLVLELGGCNDKLAGLAAQPHTQPIIFLLCFCLNILRLEVYSSAVLTVDE